MSRAERLASSSGSSSELPLSVQAELLGLSRSSLYYQPVPPSAEEIAIKHRIDEIYTKYPFYGSRRITVAVAPGGDPGQPQGGAAPHAGDGHRRHLPGTESEQAQC